MMYRNHGQIDRGRTNLGQSNRSQAILGVSRSNQSKIGVVEWSGEYFPHQPEQSCARSTNGGRADFSAVRKVDITCKGIDWNHILNQRNFSLVDPVWEESITYYVLKIVVFGIAEDSNCSSRRKRIVTIKWRFFLIKGKLLVNVRNLRKCVFSITDFFFRQFI